jgi:hypothetical protein
MPLVVDGDRTIAAQGSSAADRGFGNLTLRDDYGAHRRHAVFLANKIDQIVEIAITEGAGGWRDWWWRGRRIGGCAATSTPSPSTSASCEQYASHNEKARDSLLCFSIHSFTCFVVC